MTTATLFFEDGGAITIYGSLFNIFAVTDVVRV